VTSAGILALAVAAAVLLAAQAARHSLLAEIDGTGPGELRATRNVRLFGHRHCRIFAALAGLSRASCIISAPARARAAHCRTRSLRTRTRGYNGKSTPFTADVNRMMHSLQADFVVLDNPCCCVGATAWRSSTEGAGLDRRVRGLTATVSSASKGAQADSHEVMPSCQSSGARVSRHDGHGGSRRGQAAARLQARAVPEVRSAGVAGAVC
jgi:hypothetical protein